jgi:hypothetical protein
MCRRGNPECVRRADTTLGIGARRWTHSRFVKLWWKSQAYPREPEPELELVNGISAM